MGPLGKNRVECLPDGSHHWSLHRYRSEERVSNLHLLIPSDMQHSPFQIAKALPQLPWKVVCFRCVDHTSSFAVRTSLDRQGIGHAKDSEGSRLRLQTDLVSVPALHPARVLHSLGTPYARLAIAGRVHWLSKKPLISIKDGVACVNPASPQKAAAV